MVDFNKVILIGNLTRDPELRYTPSGLAVSTLPLAINNRYRQNEEDKVDVCYIDVVTFGKQAENCNKYLNKGNSVIVDGRLQERRWESQDGQKRSKHEVVAQRVTFMPKKSEGMKESSGSGYQERQSGPANLNDDEVPF